MADKRLDQTTNASAVAAADNIPFVTAAGVTSYVTGDELAASGPFSSRYKPLASDTIWIPAPQMSATQGSPTLGGVPAITYWSSWRLDASTTEQVASSFVVPPNWTTAHVDLYWVNAGAGAGDVRLAMSYRVNMAAGDNLNTNVTDSATQTVTAGSQNILVVTRMVTSWGLPAAGRVTTVAPYRLGADAADTLANDISVLGVLLTRVT